MSLRKLFGDTSSISSTHYHMSQILHYVFFQDLLRLQNYKAVLVTLLLRLKGLGTMMMVTMLSRVPPINNSPSVITRTYRYMCRTRWQSTMLTANCTTSATCADDTHQRPEVWWWLLRDLICDICGGVSQPTYCLCDTVCNAILSCMFLLRPRLGNATVWRISASFFWVQNVNQQARRLQW